MRLPAQESPMSSIPLAEQTCRIPPTLLTCGRCGQLPRAVCVRAASYIRAHLSTVLACAFPCGGTGVCPLRIRGQKTAVKHREGRQRPGCSVLPAPALRLRLYLLAFSPALAETHRGSTAAARLLTRQGRSGQRHHHG